MSWHLLVWSTVEINHCFCLGCFVLVFKLSMSERVGKGIWMSWHLCKGWRPALGRWLSPSPGVPGITPRSPDLWQQVLLSTELPYHQPQLSSKVPALFWPPNVRNQYNLKALGLWSGRKYEKPRIELGKNPFSLIHWQPLKMRDWPSLSTSEIYLLRWPGNDKENTQHHWCQSLLMLVALRNPTQ